MQRHEALADLSRDHHHGLVAAKHLVEVSQGGNEEKILEAGEAFVRFWDDELGAHFTEEEHVLLPVYQRVVDISEDEGVQRMIADHAWFRDKVPQLAAALDAGDPVRDRVRVLGQRLRNHARFEDRELFPRIEQALGEDALAEIHERSKAFRRAHRREAAIGPRERPG